MAIGADTSMDSFHVGQLSYVLALSGKLSTRIIRT